MAKTLVYNSGFEYGLAAPVALGTGLFDTITGSPSITSTTPINGSYSLRCYAAAAAIVSVTKIGFSANVGVIRFKVRFDAFPNGIKRICILQNALASYRIACYFDNTDNKLFFSCYDYVKTSKYGTALQTGVTYRIEMRVDYNTTTYVTDIKVDGNDVTQFADTGRTATTFTGFLLGICDSATADIYFDDAAVSVTSGDWPLGAGGSQGRRPSAEGTHNPGTNVMEDSAGNDIDGVTYTAYDKLDDDPWVTNSTDYIQQAANGTGNYCEVLFQDTDKTTINGVRAILQYRSATATANNAGCIVIDEDALETEVWGKAGGLKDYSESSAYYKSVQLPAPAGGWDQAAVNALKARFGYSSDANPDPWWTALILEVDYAEGPSLQTISPGGIASAEAFGTLKANFTLPSVGGIAGAEDFGTQKVNFTLAPSGIAGAEEFGNPELNLALLLAAIESLEAFGTPTMIITGPQTIYPEGILTLEAFGTPRLNLSLLAQAITTAEEFGVGRFNFILAPAGIGTGEEHGTPTLHFRLALSGIESGETFGTPAVSLLSGPQYILPEAIVSTEAFGQPGLSLRLYASGIASSEAFGQARIALYLNPAAIASLEAVGTPQINFALLAQAIESAEALGTPSLFWDQIIAPAGIMSLEAFGTVIVLIGASSPIVFAVAERPRFGTAQGRDRIKPYDPSSRIAEVNKRR